MSEPPLSVRWQAAAADLRPFVSGFVERRDHLPFGESLELPLARPLLHATLGADYGFGKGGRVEPMPHLALWGFNEHRRETCPAGRLHAFVAVLTFRGAELLAPNAARVALGQSIDLAARPGAEGPQLLDRLRAAPGFAERCAIVQRVFRDRAVDAAPPGVAQHIADGIASNRLAGPVGQLAQRAGVNERTLRQQFQAALGVSPKRMLRIARLNRAMRALNPLGWGDPEITDVRLEFFDDAHFHNEFRSLTGMTPREFQRRKRESGGALNYSLLGRPAIEPPGAKLM